MEIGGIVNENPESVIDLLQDVYSRVNLIPVIGSGFSVPFGLPNWGKLVEIAAVQFNLDKAQLKTIDEFLKKWKYLDAIDVILNAGVTEESLQQKIADIIYDAKSKADVSCYNNYTDLAQMHRLRFLTTNYDKYINDFSDAKSFPLENLQSIKVNEFPQRKYDNIVIPLHGEIDRPSSIVFLKNSYDALYNSDCFERNFQHLRTNYTFLFMGFSFDDPRFASMFEKIVNRYEATHYILLERSEQIKNKEKIEKLHDDYCVEAIFFDAPNGGYTESIHTFLKDVFQLKDVNIDTSHLKRLPESISGEMTEEEKRFVESGRKAIKEEQISTVWEMYEKAFHADVFQSHSADYQIEIVVGLTWYYGYFRDNEAGEKIIEQALRNPQIKQKRSKLTFMYGQILWNLRDYDKCIDVLNAHSDSVGSHIDVLNSRSGDMDPLLEVFKDIVICYKTFLPNRYENKDDIQVYGSVPRSEKEQQEYRAVYMSLKQKYINEETYNLLNVEKYKDIETQHIVYMYMGVAAGQLFHEHREAVEYLNRAYELVPTMTVCEELAHNYLAIAEEKTRYNKNAKTHEIDVNSLLKAKVRFQYIMNFNDPQALKSFYKTCGMAYLRTLYLLRDYCPAEEFYENAHGEIPDSYDLWTLKAELDAYYKQSMDESVIDKLTLTDKAYIEFLCASNRAGIFDRINPWEAHRIRRTILEKGKELPQPITDKRILQLLIDAVLFVQDIPYYEWLVQNYPVEVFEDVRKIGFEDELYGRIELARSKMEDSFDKYGDYQGTFHILKGFYLRHNMKKEYKALYQRVIDNLPDKMYETPQFFEEYITSEMDWAKRGTNPLETRYVSVWQLIALQRSQRDSTWRCISLYHKYGDKLSNEGTRKKEFVESLKSFVADYSDYEDRIAWNRYMLLKAPVPGYRAELYLAMLKLYIANMQYKKAEEIVEEMKRNDIPFFEGFDRLTMVCLREQKSKYYTKISTPLSPTTQNLDELERDMNIGWWIGRMMDYGRNGGSVLLSIRQIMYLYKTNQQKLLESIPRVYLCYAGLINLQNALWGRESPFLRMILQGLSAMKNLSLVAPEFESVCEYAPNCFNRDNSAETIQVKLFAMQNPEIIDMAGGYI